MLEEGEKKSPIRLISEGREMFAQVLLKKTRGSVSAEFYTSHQRAFVVSKAKHKPISSMRSVANRFREIAVLYAAGSNTEHFTWFCTPRTSEGGH